MLYMFPLQVPELRKMDVRKMFHFIPAIVTRAAGANRVSCSMVSRFYALHHVARGRYCSGTFVPNYTGRTYRVTEKTVVENMNIGSVLWPRRQ